MEARLLWTALVSAVIAVVGFAASGPAHAVGDSEPNQVQDQDKEQKNVQADPVVIEMPADACDLLDYLPGTTWRMDSPKDSSYGRGTLIFKKDGYVEHVYANGRREIKRWGVIDHRSITWGGGNMRVMTFSEDLQRFEDSRFESTGVRMP